MIPTKVRRLGTLMVATAVLSALLLPVAGPAGAHGFHVSAGPQLSDDGTVVVESLFTMQQGFVVLHADGGGEPGEPVGHVAIGPGYHGGVEVTADEAFWEGVDGSRTLWVAVHGDDGDGEFEPGTDEIAAFGGSRAVARVPVGRTEEGRTYVLSGRNTQEAPDPAVYVPRVALAEDGFVVLRTGGDGGGRVVGHAALDAGDHRRVRVPLNESFFASAKESLSLRAVVYRDDGDGEFSPGDEPVTVDGQPVATELAVRKTSGSRVTPSNATAAPSGTPPASRTGTGAAGPTDPAFPGAPGLGVAAGVAALAGLVLVLRATRRRSG